MIQAKIKKLNILLFFVIFFLTLFVLPVKNVFAVTLLSDTFSGTTIDTVKWQEVDSTGIGGSSGAIRQSDALTVVGKYSWGGNRLVSKTTFNRSDSPVLQTDFSFSSLGEYATSLAFGTNNTFNNAVSEVYMLAVGTSNTFLIGRSYQGTWTWTSTGVSVTANRRYRGIMHVLPGSGAAFNLYQDLNSDGDFNDVDENNDLLSNLTITTGTFSSGNFMVGSFSGVVTTTIYDARVSIEDFVPEAPTSLASLVEPNQISLSWVAPAIRNGVNITDYIIEYKLTSESSWSIFNDGVSTTTSAIVNGLVNGNSYDFRVSAVNPVGAGAVSSIVTNTPNYSIPSYTQSLSALTGIDSRIYLSWVAPVSSGGLSITDYIVEYKLTTESSWSTFNDGVATSTSVLVTPLTDGNSYNFRVSAVNSFGVGVASDIATATTTRYDLTDNFSGTAINTVKWQEVDATGVGGSSGAIRQSDALTVVGNNSWGGNRLVSKTTFNRSDSPVLQTDFSFSVSGDYSTPLAFGTNNTFNNASAEVYMLAAGVTGDFLIGRSYQGTWTWTSTGVSVTANRRYRGMMHVLPGSGATFNLYQDLSGDGDFNDISENTDLLSRTITTGTFSSGNFMIGSFSSLSTTTIYDARVSTEDFTPDAPTSLEAFAGANQISLSWVAPANSGGVNITDYIVEYKLTSESSWSIFNDGMSATTSTIVTGLANGNSYDFRVSAVNINGYGKVSSLVSRTPVLETPLVPTAINVAIPDIASVGYFLTGSYTFVDPNGDNEATSLFRWLRSDTLNGTYTPISGATNIKYNVVLEDLNKYLKFEVTPVSNTIPTIGISVVSSSTNQVFETNYLNHIISTGQSLSLGTDGSPALSTSQPYSNKMLNGDSLVDLVESGVESMSSGLANTITNLSPGGDYQSVVTRNGVGGAAYSSLKKGTSPYDSGIDKVNKIMNAANILDRRARVIGVTTIHGESDHLANNGDYYQGYLEEWQSDYDTDVKLITKQSNDVILFTDQVSSFTVYSSSSSPIPSAQLSAAENSSGKIVLVAPKYFFNYSVGAHLTNSSYRWLGEYYGKVIKKVVVDRDGWRPLSPDLIVRSGNIIYADFHVPEGSLNFDTTLVSARTNYGFEYYDNTNSASINTVEIIDGNTVKITLSNIPNGGNQRLRYAHTGADRSQAGAQNSGSVAGNLRDSDSTISLYGNTLYNWSVQFDKSITLDAAAPIISINSESVNNNSYVLSFATNEHSSALLEYGLTTNYENTTPETNTLTRVTSHNVSLSNLSPCTTYHYRVRSKDTALNEGFSSDRTFTTTGCTASSAVSENQTSQVDKTTGGTLTLKDSNLNGLALNIPVAFATSSANFQAHKLDRDTVLNTISKPSGVVSAGNYIYELKALSSPSSTISVFDNPLTISITYSANDISGVDESSLKIYRWDTGVWTQLSNCSVNTNTKTVTCETSHFSTFGLFGQETVNDTTSSGSSLIINTPCSSVLYDSWQETCMSGRQFRNILSQAPNLCSLTTEQRAQTERVCGETANTEINQVSSIENVYNYERSALSKIIDKKLSAKLAGRILLQVENKGQAWYLDTKSLTRYYLADGHSAYQALRQFGLGITNIDLNKIPVAPTSVLPSDYIKATNFSNNLVNRLKGKILLQVENRGEAWYLNPNDGLRYYLVNGEAAYQIMRQLSLGITNENIWKIGVGDFK